jgi:hypothetical protein
MNERQIQIADNLLKYLVSRGGQCNKDTYAPYLKELGFTIQEYTSVIRYLLDLDLIKEIGNEGYWIRIKVKGYEAAELGLIKYLGREKTVKFWDLFSKKATWIIASSGLILTVIFRLFPPVNNNEQKVNEKIQQYQDSNRSDEETIGHLPPVYYESLKHDSIFLDRIMELAFQRYEELQQHKKDSVK